ncbi:hypothetical protein [Candidatus Nitrosotalea okcheonensis]|uniref:Uncharacterized protein n=1 Tax=Candidatus Nitrosotalea okcheonensis TaxID=1903276 RepID=A0A2H1FEN3_9ARCH|nr:hypothetical protein [Candidatus Nitrosotalea okcheonensis]SMH71220.1 conserved exported protein of unknown function [Candidatus Nitrosotalea okcheonensis]
MDKRIFFSGVAMFAVGLLSLAYLSNTEPAEKPGMTEQETKEFYKSEATNTNLSILSQVLSAIGFVMLLVGIGLNPKNKGGVGKAVIQKPANTM